MTSASDGCLPFSPQERCGNAAFLTIHPLLVDESDFRVLKTISSRLDIVFMFAEVQLPNLSVLVKLLPFPSINDTVSPNILFKVKNETMRFGEIPFQPSFPEDNDGKTRWTSSSTKMFSGCEFHAAHLKTKDCLRSHIPFIMDEDRIPSQDVPSIRLPAFSSPRELEMKLDLEGKNPKERKTSLGKFPWGFIQRGI